MSHAVRAVCLILVAAASSVARAESTPPPVRIAAGASAGFTDERGRAWEADRSFVGGKPIDHGDRLVLANRTRALYRHERAGAHSFETRVANGRYTVVLHFVEQDAGRNPGQRVFAVDVEGRVIEGVDPMALTTGSRVPLVFSTPAVVRDGKLTIVFRSKRGTTTISGIEILPVADAVAQPAAGDRTVLDPAALAGRKLPSITDDRTGPNVQALDGTSGLPGPWAVRVDYGVNTSLPYANRSYFTFEASAFANPDLAGRRSIAFWLRPDGTGRRVFVELRDAGKKVGSVGVTMDGTDPVLVRAPLDHMGRDAHWFTDPGGDSLTGKVVSLKVAVDAAGTLGGGSFFIGPVLASDAVATPLPAPPGADKGEVGADRFRIEGFERYRTDDDVQRAYGFTSHGGMSVVSLDREHKGRDGRQGVRLDYGFGKRAYAGIVIFQNNDLRPYNVLRLWLRGDGSRNKLRLFNAAGGYYTTLVPLDDVKGKVVDLPFSDWIGYPALANGRIEWGLWVTKGEGGADFGTVYLDDIELVRDPARPMGFAKAPAPVPLPGDRTSRIDVGSEIDRTDGAGRPWISDRGYYWGRGKSWDTDEPSAPLPYRGPLRDMFKTERYGMAGYGFAIANGKYVVHLVFGESWGGALAPGRRVCGLEVNGTKQPDVDIFAETRARYLPLERKIPVDVTAGKLEILFRDIVNHCKLDALVVAPAALEEQEARGPKWAAAAPRP